MKKISIYPGLLLAVILLITACSKDDTDTNPTLNDWKSQNQQAFTTISKDPAFTQLKLEGTNQSIYYKVIKQGNGKKVSDNCTVQTHYKGWFTANSEKWNIKNGAIFDQSTGGSPFKVRFANGKSNVIIGWELALKTMTEGEAWEVWIPYQLAYGSTGAGNTIPGYSTLAFEMEIVKIDE